MDSSPNSSSNFYPNLNPSFNGNGNINSTSDFDFDLVLRAGHDTELSETIIRTFSSAAPLKTWTTVNNFTSECHQLQSLRGKCISRPSIDAFLNYGSAIHTLALSTPLESAMFTWSNSLGSSRTRVNGKGLYFELLNVMYNCAALLFNARRMRDASSLFMHLYKHILPKVAIPPTELSGEILLLLSKLSLALSLRSENPWMCCQMLKNVCENELQASKPLIDNIKSQLSAVIFAVIQECGSSACLKVGLREASSRSIRSRQLARGALENCIIMNPGSENARIAEERLKMVEMGRRNVSRSLMDVDAVFNPAELFDTFELDFEFGLSEGSGSSSNPICTIPEFQWPKSLLLKNILPPSIAAAPFLHSLHLQTFVEVTILSQLHTENQKRRLDLLSSSNSHAPKKSDIASLRTDVIHKSTSLQNELQRRINTSPNSSSYTELLQQFETELQLACRIPLIQNGCSGSMETFSEFSKLRKKAKEYDFLSPIKAVVATDPTKEWSYPDLNFVLRQACEELLAAVKPILYVSTGADVTDQDPLNTSNPRPNPNINVCTCVDDLVTTYSIYNANELMGFLEQKISLLVSNDSLH